MCSKGIAKFILFVTNFFLFIAGGILLGFGIAAKVDPVGLSQTISKLPKNESSVVDVGELVANSGTFMIVVGCFLFVFCFLGFCGSCKEITWMLFLYWVALLLIILLQIALIIFAVVSPGKMKEESVKVMNKKFEEYKPETIKDDGTLVAPTDPNSLTWFGLQYGLKCCGVESMADYEKLTSWNRKYSIKGVSFNAMVPPSCCIDSELKNVEGFVECMKEAKNVHQLGCYDAVDKELKKASYIPIVVCVVIILIEVISIAAAIYLWRQSKSGHMSV